MTLRPIGDILAEVVPTILDGTFAERLAAEQAERRHHLVQLDETYRETPDPRRTHR